MCFMADYTETDARSVGEPYTCLTEQNLILNGYFFVTKRDKRFEYQGLGHL